MKGKLKLASNKKTWLLIREDGKEMQVPAISLTRTLFPLNPQKHDGLEAEYELDKGQPVRVHEVSAEWQPQSSFAPIQGGQKPHQQTGSPRGGPRRPQYQAGRESRPQRQQFDRQPNRPSLPGDFHNPYNFVPAPPRKTDPELGDREPVGHDRYKDDLWSGRIAVKLTTHSPLLMLDAGRAETFERNPDHKIFPIRIGADGKPYLPPTSVKGMLRSAFEVVTNSRFTIFEKHQDRLAYRMSARGGKDSPVPARVEERNSRLGLRIMRRTEVMGFAAKLPRYQDGRQLPKDKGEYSTAIRYPDEELPRHGEPVWVRLDRSWVSNIRPRTSLQPPTSNWQAGWVCIAGPNINRKRYERVFLEAPDDQFIPITSEHEELWRELIQNYKDTHERDLEKRKKHGKPQDYLGNSPGETGWSRHIYETGAEKLREGTLCYVEFESPDSDKVRALIPVTISRRLFEVSPDSLLPKSLKPTQTLKTTQSSPQLSPAERIFGWVSQDGKGAYRGNLRIGPVHCVSPNPLMTFKGDGVPLAILGQPKPQQARFYAAQSEQGEAQENGYSKEKGYWQGKGLRGRKVYPHHANLPPGYWDKPWEDRTQQSKQDFFQEYRRPRKPEIDENNKVIINEQRDDQNRSITGWIKPQTVFEFEIDLTNFSSVELGALLWLLLMPSDHFHRLGGGKPLGFGSVRLEVDWENTDLRTGAQWRDAYFTLDEAAPLNVTSAQASVEKFQQAVASAYGNGNFDQTSFIAAFIRCAKGFTKPVHYPRALQEGQQRNSTIPPHPEGKAYEWFVANERLERGHPVFGLALPNLVDDEGLPILKAR